MDHKDLLRAAFLVLAGLVVLAAVVAAGYMLVSALTGIGDQPASSPTPAPVTPTPSPEWIVPAGPMIPTGTPGPSGYPAIPTAAQPLIESAELSGYGTDKDTYKAGDTAYVYFIIKNTGNAVINNATLKISVSKYFSIVGYQNVGSSTETLTDLNIGAGETKNATYGVNIPSSYEGLSTSGKYKFTVVIHVWDKDIGTFAKEVTVQ